jgi:hypothetical protein
MVFENLDIHMQKKKDGLLPQKIKSKGAKDLNLRLKL